MENKYGMQIEYDVSVPVALRGACRGAAYRELVNDFINSKHEVMMIKCGDLKTANSKRTAIKRIINPEAPILLMVRQKDVYLVKTDIRKEEK